MEIISVVFYFVLEIASNILDILNFLVMSLLLYAYTFLIR